MKKLLIFAAIFVILVTIGVSVFAVVKLSSLDGEDEAPQASTLPSNEESVKALAYAKQNYPDYTAKYDAKSHVLTLEKTTEFSLKSAQSIYTDSSTYLTQARIFALDIAEACGDAELIVELCYLSKDGERMFSVASDGTVTKYWE